MSVAGRRSLPLWILAALLVTAAAVNAFDYSVLVPLQQVRRDTHRAVVEGRADAPQQYRVLVPLVLDTPIRLIARVLPYEKAFGRTYAAYHLVALTLALAALSRYLRVWFSAEQALAGALIVGSTIHLALRQGEYWDMASIPPDGVFAPSSLLEPTLVAFGLLLIIDDRRWALAGWIVVAALNSEAGVLLPLLFLVTRRGTRNHVLHSLAYLAVWAAVSVAVRQFMGSRPGSFDVGDVVATNLQNLPTLVINLVLFLGPVWMLLPMGWHRTPVFARRALLVIPLYVMGVVFWGNWWDVRNLMPLYPILLPPALAALFAPRGDGPQ